MTRCFSRFLRMTACTLALALSVTSVTVPVARARMISTEQALATAESHAERARLAQFLDREDVRQLLTQQGIAPAEAQARVAALTDAEVRQAVQQFDQLPAAGSALGTIIGAAVLVFLVLLVTDILGFTHIYPFVNHHR